MHRLRVLAEGQTEESFVKSVLAPHLGEREVFAVARSVETRARKKGLRRGGLSTYAKFRADLERWMKEEGGSDVTFTTMVDLYGLPSDFPGFEEASRLGDPYKRVEHLESQLAADIADSRLVPYVQLHEFETLLLVDPQQLEWAFLEHDEPIADLVSMVSEFEGPELINDSPESAPSKRIAAAIPEFAGQKAAVGPLVTGKVGVAKLRETCHHFGAWLSKLEALPKDQGTA